MRNGMCKGIGAAVETVFGIALFAVGFYFVLWMMRGGDSTAQKIYAAEALKTASAVVDEADMDEEFGRHSIEIYVEGDGEPPMWYQPNEEMAAEWTDKVPQGNLSQRRDIGCGSDVGIDEEVLYDVPLDVELQRYIRGLCEESGLPVSLVLAVIEQESNYDPAAISKTDDWGLMQINAVCHGWLVKELGIADFLDPYQNVRAGVHILAGYYQKYGYVSGALVAYNIGQAAEELFSQGIYSTNYSDRVIGIMYELESEE